MSARKDADRVVALVVLVEKLAKGESMVLGEIASQVFGWDPERVFLAIDAALAAGLIGKNKKDGRIVAPELAVPAEGKAPQAKRAPPRRVGGLRPASR